MDEVAPEVPAHILIRPIGKGAFGKVWLARNVMGTYRAVKIVSRTTLERENDFQREFKGIQKFEPVSRLHDGLVDVLQIGYSADAKFFYYVMELGDDVEPRQEFALDEYVPRTLSAECRRRTRIPANETSLIGAQLAAALAFLHKSNLIHRDIKPSNVLFVRGQAKIGDPGLVAAMEAAVTLGGTLGYIPPEGPGTPKADIFSLGKLLYVITTAKEPGEFPRLPADMMTYEDADDLRRLNPVILRACAFNPDRRYASAEDLRKDLLEAHAGGSPEETRRRLRLARNIALILILLLMLIGAGYYRTLRQARAERARLTQNLMETANRTLEQRDPLGALPYLGAILTTDPEDEQKVETAARLISFAWRYDSPRLLQQWVFTNGINQVAFHPEGHHVAIADAFGRVWIWPWRTGAPQLLGEHGLPQGRSDAEAVAFSSDGEWLASIGTDATIRGWRIEGDPTNITVRLRYPGHALAFLKDTKQVVAGCEGAVYRVDLQSGAVTEISPLDASAISLALHPDQNTLLVGTSTPGAIHQFQLDGSLQPSKVPHLWVYDLAFNRDATSIAAATGNRARLDPFAPSALSRLRHPTLVRSISYDPTRKSVTEDRLLTACIDNTVRLWSCAEDEEVMRPIHTAGLPSSVRFHPDGETFTVATLSGVIRVYRMIAATNEAGIERTAVSGDSMHYARVELHGNVMVRNATSDWLEAPIAIPEPPVTRLCLDHAGKRLLTSQASDGDGQMKLSIWDVSGLASIATTNFPLPLEADLSPDGRSVAIRLKDRLVLWAPDSGRSFQWEWTVEDPRQKTDLRFSGRSPRAVVSWSSNVMVFSTATGETISRWPMRYKVNAIDINPAGDRVVVGETPTGLSPAAIYVWEPETTNSARKVNPNPMKLEDGCYLARFNSDGSQLVLTDEADNCVVYDCVRWKPLTFRQPTAITVDTDFSSDGSLFATMTGDRGGAKPTIRVWDLRTGQAFTPVLESGVPKRLGAVRFIGGVNGLLWFSRNGEWKRWRLGRMDASNEELTALSQLLSCRRISESGETISLSPQELQGLWLKLWSQHPDWFSSATQ
jgi:WD40 repeat protein